MLRIQASVLAVLLLASGCARNPAAGSRAPDRPVASPAAEAETGAPRSVVSLDLSLAPDLSAVDGSMTLHYVNQEPGSVDRVRLLSYPGLVGVRQ
jgi:hypothetical protein